MTVTFFILKIGVAVISDFADAHADLELHVQHMFVDPFTRDVSHLYLWFDFNQSNHKSNK